jgi:hypothetical protein
MAAAPFRDGMACLFVDAQRHEASHPSDQAVVHRRVSRERRCAPTPDLARVGFEYSLDNSIISIIFY